eukprot:TRINITY_DN10037_c0_g1_i3.p1 TRINITY_DN10037_c0_g1~~TRINITY_DN10037_c0_g1_i3.p1  ORF type:complete len:897 (-),score=192.14 TRINITY_DN10037_c0_g1_i3:70-2760(-)
MVATTLIDEKLTGVLPHSVAKQDSLASESRNSGVRSSHAWREDHETGQAPRESWIRQSAVHGKKSRKSAFRQALTHTPWYHSEPATLLRRIVQGRAFGALIVACLFLALFLPDLWVICGINSTMEVDVILTLVMIVFISELVMFSAVDASYLLSFFFAMDIVGTATMIMDITYFGIGTDHTMPQETSSNAGANFVLLKATRSARVGARAGRISRVLRILRYLPFLTGSVQKFEKKEDKGIASVISGRLGNLLATRVACLTIVLVILIPVFELWTFPGNDYSLRTWADRLAVNAAEGRMEDLMSELHAMTDFYKHREYGPYLCCLGTYVTGSGFDCETVIEGWQPHLEAPRRGASSHLVHSRGLMVGFNMHQPKQIESAMSIATVLFIIFIMVFSSLALSNVVTELTVRPLERMLGTVRQIATTVFKFSAEVMQDDDESGDIDQSSEMKLLEKVVQKLAVVADLQAPTEYQTTEDMRAEDIGILSMMQGKNIVDEKAKNDRRSCAVSGRKKAQQPVMRLEDFGVTQEAYQSWGFNPMPLSKVQRCQLATFTISRFHDPGEGYVRTREEEATLQRFVAAAEKEYLPNPFHSFAHAIDVAHGVSRIMRLMDSEAFLTELEQFSLLVAAVAHDLGHPGVNNGFLAEVGHELALQYNDRSPLENMHCAKLYTIVANKETNVFLNLPKELYREARKYCIETILHTDMMGHQAMVKDLTLMYQMNREVFLPPAQQQAQKQAEANGQLPQGMSPEVEVFSSSENKSLIMDCILHSADVSNPCRTWDVTQAWATVCLEEFFAQGDQEKLLGIPVQFLNDREKLNRPNSQIGFIEFMIAPFFAAQIRLFTALHEFGNLLASNIETWEELWAADTSPSDEERQKVRGRVDRVRNSLQQAQERVDASM